MAVSPAKLIIIQNNYSNLQTLTIGHNCAPKHFLYIYIYINSWKAKQYGWQKLKRVMFDSCNLGLID